MRIKNSLLNIFFGLFSQISSALMGIVVRTVFIATLGIEYLGVNGLFTNILTMLSLANLGFDTAIIYSLYKPLAERNEHYIQALMNLYRKAYRIIGLIVLLIGLALIPFLPFLMNGETSVQHIEWIYVLFLLNSVSSYYLAYKHSIITADQKNHIISKVHTFFTFISNISQIVLLLTTYNFILVLTLQLVIQVLKNLYLTKKSNQYFPFIREKNSSSLTSEERKLFIKNLYSLMLYKISGVVINGTDNLIISIFIGVYWVGIYSNYFLIITTISTFISYIFSSLTASVGNLIVKENNEKTHSVFNIIQFANFWVYGLISIYLLLLINPIIKIWIGEEYLLGPLVVLAIILNFFTAGMQGAATIYREATGLFRIGKYRPIFAALINIIVSMILVKQIGIAGVFYGTIISRLCTYFWFDPYVIFKHAFHKPLKGYFYRYCIFTVAVGAAALINLFVMQYIDYEGLMSIIVNSVFCIVITNAMFFFLYRKSDELKYLLNLARDLLIKKKLVKVLVKGTT